MYVCGECGHRGEQAGVCPRDGLALGHTDDPLLGTVVGRYRLARVLGEGGMGRVYLAVQPELGSRVAIKIISDKHAQDEVQLDRFFAEARAVNLIRHENIVNVLDLDQLPDGRPVIVMELVEGDTLRKLLRGGNAPIGGVVQVMIEVLGAISAAHAIGIVHRDLKPDNILVTATGRAKVLDFGIAKLAISIPGRPTPRTRTGVVMGTPEYMAPEQINGGTVDARCDIYAAGVVMFEAVTGQQPFAGLHGYELLRAHVEQPPPSPRTLRRDLPEALESVILTALAKQRGHRFTTANAMANALHAASAGLPAEQWRALTPAGRMFPRSSTSPAPFVSSEVTAETGPIAGRNRSTAPGVESPTLRDRPSARKPEAIGITVLDRPTAKRGHGSDELPNATAPEPAPPRHRPGRSRIGVAVLAACVGGGIAALALALRGPTDAVPSSLPAGPAVGPPVVGSSVPPDVPTVATPPPQAAQLDPIAQLVAAEQIARQTLPDADLIGFSLELVFPDGLLRNGVGMYMFRSRRSGQCVSIGPSLAVIPSTPGCSTREVTPHPRCSVREVWVKAFPSGLPPNGAILGLSSTRGHASWTLQLFDPKSGPLGDPKRIDDDCRVAPATGGNGATAAPHASAAVSADDVISQAPDYDPSHFDPIAYLPRAQQLARRLIADAGPIGLDFSPITANGHVDLSAADGATEQFRFRAAQPAPPRGGDGLAPCFVTVDVSATRAIATRVRAPACGAAQLAWPRCSIPTMWALGKLKHAQTARVTWTSSYYQADWKLELGASAGPFAHEDDCGNVGARPRPEPAPEPDEATAHNVIQRDFDHNAFEVRRFLTTAAALAKQLVDDAALVQIKVLFVASDGHVTWESRFHLDYRFRSPSRSLILQTADNAGQHPCLVDIEVSNDTQGKLVAKRIDDRDCAEAFEPAPRCGLADVWQKALARGIAGADDGVLTYRQGHWELAIREAQPVVIDDNCK